MSTQIEQFTKAPNPLDDQDVFDVDMARHMAEELRFVTQANQLGSEMQTNADIAAALILAMALPQFAGTSTTSQTIGTGTKSFATQTGKEWVVGQVVIASSGANYMKGQALAYNAGTGVLDVNVTSVNGSGTYASWTIGLSYEGLSLAKSGVNSDITSLTGLIGPGLLPVGSVCTSTGNTAPTGYIKANGTLLSRTAYANLWAFAQASGNLAASDGAWTNGQYSPGDGSTTFRIPDLRAEFLRFWDDGRGVDSGRAFGSTQLDQMQRITGTVDAGAGNSGARLINGSASGAFALTKAGGTGYMVTGVGYTTTDYTTSEVFDSGNSPSARVSSTTAGETRSRNVAYLPCIKY